MAGVGDTPKPGDRTPRPVRWTLEEEKTLLECFVEIGSSKLRAKTSRKPSLLGTYVRILAAHPAGPEDDAARADSYTKALQQHAATLAKLNGIDLESDDDDMENGGPMPGPAAALVTGGGWGRAGPGAGGGGGPGGVGGSGGGGFPGYARPGGMPPQGPGHWGHRPASPQPARLQQGPPPHMQPPAQRLQDWQPPPLRPQERQPPPQRPHEWQPPPQRLQDRQPPPQQLEWREPALGPPERQRPQLQRPQERQPPPDRSLGWKAPPQRPQELQAPPQRPQEWQPPPQRQRLEQGWQGAFRPARPQPPHDEDGRAADPGVGGYASEGGGGGRQGFTARSLGAVRSDGDLSERAAMLMLQRRAQAGGPLRTHAGRDSPSGLGKGGWRGDEQAAGPDRAPGPSGRDPHDISARAALARPHPYARGPQGMVSPPGRGREAQHPPATDGAGPSRDCREARDAPDRRQPGPWLQGNGRSQQDELSWDRRGAGAGAGGRSGTGSPRDLRAEAEEGMPPPGGHSRLATLNLAAAAAAAAHAKQQQQQAAGLGSWPAAAGRRQPSEYDEDPRDGGSPRQTLAQTPARGPAAAGPSSRLAGGGPWSERPTSASQPQPQHLQQHQQLARGPAQPRIAADFREGSGGPRQQPQARVNQHAADDDEWREYHTGARRQPPSAKQHPSDGYERQEGPGGPRPHPQAPNRGAANGYDWQDGAAEEPGWGQRPEPQGQLRGAEEPGWDDAPAAGPRPFPDAHGRTTDGGWQHPHQGRGSAGGGRGVPDRRPQSAPGPGPGPGSATAAAAAQDVMMADASGAGPRAAHRARGEDPSARAPATRPPAARREDSNSGAGPSAPNEPRNQNLNLNLNQRPNPGPGPESTAPLPWRRRRHRPAADFGPLFEACRPDMWLGELGPPLRPAFAAAARRNSRAESFASLATWPEEVLELCALAGIPLPPSREVPMHMYGFNGGPLSDEDE
ncbi:hypothetical protein HYH03_003710 [Edaphochlamys debaryana]|uniref:Uncharacterized protein n=1 Tax=Edaphochlamys debaryana TaxID=47281 RepID=A0A835YCS9_9CHLO|nr:hypothetical protein HYH03_003710 [Edaphochlamys debaryana]|eukprot:KAG2498456.1 hypothetical protein HYH03_003710 [Edaphochlamys debaryana]